jgi:hypothetical protein
LGVSSVATFSYFLAIGCVVVNASSYFSGEDAKDSIFNFLEGVLELIKSISRD